MSMMTNKMGSFASDTTLVMTATHLLRSNHLHSISDDSCYNSRGNTRIQLAEVTIGGFTRILPMQVRIVFH